MGQLEWLVQREETGRVGVGQPGRKKLEQEDDGGVDNEAEEDSSERYESDYGNEDDSLD